jgi:hypothetical protein
MNLFKNNLSKWHLKTFLFIYIVFTIIIGSIAAGGIDKHISDYTKLVWLTTAGSITGPMVGAISRDFQGCCLNWSLKTITIAAPILFLGILMQFINFPDKKWIHRIAKVSWVFAWVSWFLLGISTFGHALV